MAPFTTRCSWPGSLASCVPATVILYLASSLTTNRKSLVGFQDMGSDLKFGAPIGEISMTSFPVIEKRPITPKPLQIGVSFLLNTNRKSIVGFQYSINIIR